MRPWIAGLGLGATMACAASEPPRPTASTAPSTVASATPAPVPAAPSPTTDAALTQRLASIAAESDGTVGVAVIHVESGRGAAHEADKALPLYSVFKLPVVVEVLKQVEEGKLRLDQPLDVTPAQMVAGSAENNALWQKPSDRTLAEMIELAVGRSDNTSTDVMLELVGGPEVVTRRMGALGFPGIVVKSSVRGFVGSKAAHPNTASASDIARLLAGIQRGEILRAAERDVLLGAMSRATTGPQRLRGDLPSGTPVAHKTGSGPPGTGTNDVGVITLPAGKGHLVVAVLVNGSRQPLAKQEKLIATLARAAYDAFAP